MLLSFQCVPSIQSSNHLSEQCLGPNSPGEGPTARPSDGKMARRTTANAFVPRPAKESRTLAGLLPKSSSTCVRHCRVQTSKNYSLSRTALPDCHWVTTLLYPSQQPTSSPLLMPQPNPRYAFETSSVSPFFTKGRLISFTPDIYISFTPDIYSLLDISLLTQST